MFNPGFIPLFVVKNLVVVLNLNGPKSNAPKKMPNFTFGPILPRDPFPEKSLFPIETIEVARPNPAKYLNNVGGPPPRPSCLNAFPKFMFNRLASVREAKNTLFRYRCRSHPGPPLIHRYRFVPYGPNESGFFSGAERVPLLGPLKPIVARKISLPFIRLPCNSLISTSNDLSSSLGSVV